MVMVSELIESEASGLYQTLLGDASSEVLISGPPPEAIEQLVAVLRNLNDPPPVKLLAAEDALKSVMSDFLVAGPAADLTTADQLAVRANTTQPEGFVFLAENAISFVVAGDMQTAGLTTDDSTFVKQISKDYTTAWEDAAEFALRTPPISQVRESLDDELSPDIRADFDAVLHSLETARGDENGLDAVTISLLVAAKNEALLYDLGKWGENVGLASRTTFSRVKTDLEELGIIDTEKTPTDVGRPRQRLVFSDERLHDAKAPQLASIARNILPETTS
jgi:hypothetical protein